MKSNLLLLSILLLVSSCGQDYNSNSGDSGQYTPNSAIDTSTPEGARLSAAYTVLQNKCLQCHSTWSGFTTSSRWEQAGLIVTGSASGSEIVRRLKNYGGDMPPDPFSPLSNEELTAVENWIDNL